ncbi:MAG: hypothetical protein DDT19_02637 [Syntrophomonadaceae bacterium]|nr:hypothetical protein [Bacillota bacterium]
MKAGSEIEDYSQKFRIKIGDMVLKKYRFYLDTKYWIFMRNASIGKASPIQMEIYGKLRDLVKKEVAICPLSPHIFVELMNIGDKEKRLNTAKVMDELSQQVCFISPLDIVGQELLSFVRYCQAKGEGKPLFNPAKYVFTKVPFIMGEIYPTIQGLPHQQMNDIRIQFFDHLSKFTLVEILKTAKGDFPLWDRKDLIAKLNQGKDDNQNWNSFHEVFMHEIAGILDVVKDEIEKLGKYLYENDAGGSIRPEEISKSELQNSIYNVFDQKKINKELPFFHINASLHAFLRYNKMQRYKENHLIDFSHAAWALPYCNAFFTEKPLHDWICNNPLKLNEIYGSKVLWNEEDVLNTLEALDNF